jgi:hypothetical protein
MGGGYSDKFTGTDGAIGDHQHYQATLFDKLPVRTKSDEVGAGISDGGGIVPVTRMKQCFCCEEYTIPTGTTNKICPICGWIDDKFQNTHPDSLNGKNAISLKEAREIYRSENGS